MTKNKLIPLLMLGAVVVGSVFAVVGVTAVRSVMAQAPTPTVPPLGLQAGRGGAKIGYTQQDLANALGIPLEKLQAAYTAADAEALKQAVSKGLITQQQADQFAQRPFFREKMGFGLPFSANGIDYNAILANSLGITTDQLNAAYAQAFNTSVDNALKAGTITQQQADLAKGKYNLSTSSKFLAALQAAYQAAIKQAVADGIITQAQADAILAQKSGTATGPGMMLRGFGQFGHGGFGGPQGFGRHNKNGLPGGQAPTAPTPTPSNGL